MTVLGNVKAAIAEANLAHEHYQRAAEILSRGPAQFYFEKIEEYVTALFGPCAPFHVGDRVKLVAAPNTENSWSACRHFLIPGAEATIDGVDYVDGHFVADLIFDDESWIDCNGKVQPVANRHAFRIAEQLIEVLR